MGADTLQFDTVFTATGSVTKSFKIFNPASEGIRISSVDLAGGIASPFKINVNGIPGPQVSDIEIRGNDSAYVFVSVSIDPSAAALPFVIQDSIKIEYNGNTQFVQLQAYGQNAHFLRNEKITGTETWNNDLPYVILERLTVDTGAVLTITKGCKIYIHADAPFIINGSLQVAGEKWDSTRVVFTGDRLDEPYKYYPASFPGLIFTASSTNNKLDYAIIKNAYQGIVVAGLSSGTAPKLTLSQTIIDNAFDGGLIGINTSITAQNVLIGNCGKNIVLTGGGTYNFTHCTVATFGNFFIEHKAPVLSISNNVDAASAPLSALFKNCIFWSPENGLVSSEVAVVKTGNTLFDVRFDDVLWRVPDNPANVITSGAIINNQSPLFDSINTAKNSYNFRLKEDSPARGKGSASNILIDLDGAPRPLLQSDLGAYQKQ